MIVEGSWLMAVLIGTLPVVGVIGRLFGDDADGDGDGDVDDLLNDSFEDQVAFDGLEEEEDDDMFDEPADRANEELETRLDDLEGEVGNLSSTVSTVRSENEEIADVVENVEDDVRKLLEIYEMVTRGINPFIDDDIGFADGGGDADLQLFENEDVAEDDEPDDVDDDLLNADADEFFDEDAISDESPAPTDPAEHQTMEMDDTGNGGKSFEELKEEFDAGDADWADEDEALDEPAADAPAAQSTPPESTASSGTSGTDMLETEGVDVADFDEPVADADPANTTPTASVGAPGMQKPYLTHLPDHPVAELAVMEWLEFLVETTGGAGTRAAVQYYGQIGWIASDVVDDMETYLDGFVPEESSADDLALGLGRAEHVKTLQYLLAIDGASTRQFVGTTLDTLLTDGVLGEATTADSRTNASVEDFVGEPGIRADDEGAPGLAEETTLPDGGLALPLDDEPSSGVGSNGN